MTSYSLQMLKEGYRKLEEMYAELKQRRKPTSHLLIFGPGGWESGEALYVRNPTVAAAAFLAHFDEMVRGSVRVTPENFDAIFPKPGPEQLSLNLEMAVENTQT